MTVTQLIRILEAQLDEHEDSEVYFEFEEHDDLMFQNIEYIESVFFFQVVRAVY